MCGEGLPAIDYRPQIPPIFRVEITHFLLINTYITFKCLDSTGFDEDLRDRQSWEERGKFGRELVGELVGPRGDEGKGKGANVLCM